MMFSIRNISILLLIPIICVGTIFFSLNQVNEAELYNQIIAFDRNSKKIPKTSLHITKSFLPKSIVTITDKKYYKIKVTFPLLSLLKFSPQPSHVEINRLKVAQTDINLPELGLIVNQLKTHGIKQLVLQDTTQHIKLRPTKKSALLDINTAQYNLSSKLYLDKQKITGGKVHLISQGVNLLDGVANQFFNTNLYSPLLNVQFKFTNEDDKIVIRKMVDNKLNLVGEGIIPHDKEKMAQFFFTIPSISLQQLMESSPQTIQNNNIEKSSLLPNSAIFINTKIDEFKIGNEEIRELTLKMLNNSLEKQIALSGSFPSDEKFLFKSNHSYGSKVTLYKSHGSHYNLNKLFTNEQGESATNLVPVRWDLEATSTNNRFNLSSFSIQMEAADIKGQDIVTMKNNMPIHDAQLSINNVTTDNKRHLPFISPLLQYIQSLGQNISHESYLQKYVPLRNLSSAGKAKIKYKNINGWGNQFDQGEMNLEFSPAILNITKLKNISDKNQITLAAKINAEGLTPQISFNVLNGILDLSEQHNLGDSIFNHLTTTMDKALLNMDGYIKLKEIKLPNDLTLEDVKTSFNWSQNILALKNLESKVRRSATTLASLKTNTSIQLATPLRLSSALALSNINLKEASSFISWKTDVIKGGWANLSAQATLSSKTYDDLLDNLVFKGNIVAADLSVNKLGFDDTIADINNLGYSIANLYDDLSSAIGSGTTTFKKISSKLNYQEGILQATNINFNTLYSAGRANLSYHPVQEALAAKTALSFEVAKAKSRNMPNRIVKSVIYTINGDKDRGYNAEIEAEDLKDGLIAARSINNLRQQMINRAY